MSADYLGPRPKFTEMGLSTVSPSDPFIRSDTGEVCVRLAYQENLPLLWSTKLTSVTNDSSEDFSHMVSIFSTFRHSIVSPLYLRPL
ncbi:unnamed protein product [Dibothriocephalus latus]|uniref:KY-like immunoglobulin-like domain-containing protein n=1 Tax=Dibothriocephalus latus TaxID=60516 RepID=A0A3P7NRC3_DIBLA|nr:unnamed protein product [Dibothriocephalus latus]